MSSVLGPVCLPFPPTPACHPLASTAAGLTEDSAVQEVQWLTWACRGSIIRNSGVKGLEVLFAEPGISTHP